MYIVASDYDGTLKQNGIVSESDLEAIRQFQKAGHLFGIITGRAVMSIRGELEYFGVPIDFLISANGAILVDKNYEILHRFTMNFVDALNLIEELKRDERHVLGVSDGYDFGRIQEGRLDVGKVKRSKQTEAAKIDPQQILDKKVMSLLFFRSHNNDATLKLVEQLKMKFDGKITFHYNNGAVDATPYGVDKCVGLTELQKQKKGTIIPVGDGYNDVPMIEAFGGFAMTNGVQEVKDKATKVFDTIADCLNYLMNCKSEEKKLDTIEIKR